MAAHPPSLSEYEGGLAPAPRLASPGVRQGFSTRKKCKDHRSRLFLEPTQPVRSIYGQFISNQASCLCSRDGHLAFWVYVISPRDVDRARPCRIQAPATAWSVETPSRRNASSAASVISATVVFVEARMLKCRAWVSPVKTVDQSETAALLLGF